MASPMKPKVRSVSLSMNDGRSWLTLDGELTSDPKERGVWPSTKDAAKALGRFIKEGKVGK